MDTLNTLVETSRMLGQNNALVQGAGGNTSLKENEHMWIKASGCTLDVVTETDGFVAVNDDAIRTGLKSIEDEASYTALLKQQIIGMPNITKGRPSIETGFHALLGNAVLHSHSVWMNLFSCAKNGKEKAQELFPEALWVPYAAPGVPLMRAIETVISKQAETTTILLQNHGFIVSAPTLEQAAHTHYDMDKQARDSFGLSANAYEAFNTTLEADEHHVLFPDQAVYLSQPDLAKTSAGIETLKAYSFIRHTLEAANIEPQYLTSEEAAFLLDMESEKYRQKAAKA